MQTERERKKESEEKEIGWIRGAKGATVSTGVCHPPVEPPVARAAGRVSKITRICA